MPNIYITHSSCHRGLFKVFENLLKYSDFGGDNLEGAAAAFRTSKVSSDFEKCVFGEKMNNSELSNKIPEIME